MYNIAFRADGSPDIGMGHIMRCMSLAKAYIKAGCRVCFFSGYEEGIQRLVSNGFEVIKINSEYSRGLLPGVAEIFQYAESHPVDLLIVDSYKVDEDFFQKLKQAARKIAYIDDVNSFNYPVDILINGNINAGSLGYKKSCDSQIMLLGTRYNLIRVEFEGLPERNISLDVKNVMITAGGSDPSNMSCVIAEEMLKREIFADIKINLVVGSAFRNKDQLRKLADKNENLVLSENPGRISEIMLRSDIAVSAGGSTLYELAACGTPTMAYITADNQAGIVEKMASMGYISSLGRFDSFSAEMLAEKYKELKDDFYGRRECSPKMQKLVDGKGASRVVEKTLKAIQQI